MGAPILEAYYQNRTEDVQGMVTPTDDGRYVIQLFNGANVSTIAHETSHVFFLDMQRRVLEGSADEQMQKDWASLQEWLRQLDDDTVFREQYDAYISKNAVFKGRKFENLDTESKALARQVAGQEMLARGWEQYLREGKAPSSKLDGFFRRMSRWLKKIYQKATSLDIKLTDEVRDVFSRMLVNEKTGNATKPAPKKTIKAYEAGTNLPPASGRPGIAADEVRKTVNKLTSQVRNGCKVEIVQSAKDLPERIQSLLGGKNVEGVYVPSSDSVYLIADNIAGAERAAEVYMHETVAHHGLRTLFAPNEMRSVLHSLFMQSGGMSNAGIRSIAEKYGIDPRKGGADEATVMEEYIAKLAEGRAAGRLSKAEQGIFSKLVEAVKRAWNRIITKLTGKAAKVDSSSIEGLLKSLEASVFDGKGGRSGKTADTVNSAESQSINQRTAEERLDEDVKAWENAVDAFIDGTLNPHDRVTVMKKTPLVLSLLGADKDLPIITEYSKLKKILKDKHKLPESVLKQVPRAITDPVMVFESATMKGDYVMMLDLKDQDGATVVVPVSFNYEPKKGYVVNYMPSVYGQKDDTGTPRNTWFLNQIRNGNLRYRNNKKSRQWLTSTRLQLPWGGSNTGDKGNVFSEQDLVKAKNDNQAYYRVADDQAPMASLLSDAVNRVLDAKPSRPSAGYTASELASNPNLASARGKIGTKPQSIREKWNAATEDIKTKLEQGIFDSFASIEKYSEEGYVQARLTTNLGSQITAMMVGGHPVWNDGAMDVQGKSLIDVFSPVKGEIDRFLEWMVARRANRLMQEGREHNFTQEEIDALLKNNQGKMASGKPRADVYRKVFDDFAEYLKTSFLPGLLISVSLSQLIYWVKQAKH